jgi:hypothetical protein
MARFRIPEISITTDKNFLANVFHRQVSASASGQHLEEKTSQIFGFGNRSQDWMIRRLFEPTHASR